MKIEEFNNVKFILGQNAQENWNILDQAKKENEYYVWFHLNNFPSGYVIMYSTISDLTDNINEYLKIIVVGNERNFNKVTEKITRFRNLTANRKKAAMETKEGI